MAESNLPTLEADNSQYLPLGIELERYCVNATSVLEGERQIPPIKIDPVYRHKVSFKFWDTINDSIKGFEVDGKLTTHHISDELSDQDREYLSEICWFLYKEDFGPDQWSGMGEDE